jgi:2-polyprenyl-3-methyl-5-hydroxy-6-metoxy-1,4-benzoquinol methylase
MVARALTSDRPDGPVLDAGCGDGDLARWMAASGLTVAAADRDLRRVRAASRTVEGNPMPGVRRLFPPAPAHGDDRSRGDVRWSCDDVTALPWPDRSFAMVIASEVLEHVPDDARAARELRRVLRAGGRLIVTVPAGPGRFSQTDAAAGHVRRYDRAGLAHLLAAAGLVAITVRGWGWPFGRLYDRVCQRPALRARSTPLRGPVSCVGRVAPVAVLWRALFAVDDRFDAGDHGSGLLAEAQRGD